MCRINNHHWIFLISKTRSSVVEKVLLQAHGEGRVSLFTSLVRDQCWKVRFGNFCGTCEAEPLAGKKLLAALTSARIPSTHLLSAIGPAIAEVSTVFIGAHSLYSNGAVHSKAGTALVSMMAKQHSIPVVVCCETCKILETVQLDSFTKNELGPQVLYTSNKVSGSSLVVIPGPMNGVFSTFPISIPRGSLATGDTTNLEILNPLYDLTPPTSIGTIHMALGGMI